MKKLYSTILPIVMILCLAMLSSCSGSSDETENGGTDDGILRITADKTAIQADGVEKVTFTVKLGTQDVSEESTMNLILVKESGEENLDYGVRAFSTSVPGTYVFKARYYEGKAMVSENEVTVQVTPVSGGTSYYHKLLGMQFTSVGCQACPALSTTLKAIQNEQPGRLAVASFHMDFGGMTDPMSTAATNNYRTNILGNFSGLPRLFYNLRKGTKEMISIKSQIEEELQKELSNYPASCGVAIESVYNASDRTVTITAKLTSNVTNTYRCLIYLVEDGIKYFQTNGGNDYTHNNVVRAVVSTSLNGDRFNVLMMYAEAVVSGGTQASNMTPLQAVNKVRGRANMSELPSVTMADIQNERILEFALEGHRFYDLLRWGKLASRFTELQESDPNFKKFISADDFKGFVTNKHEWLPIPINEVNSNPYITENNPGY